MSALPSASVGRSVIRSGAGEAGFVVLRKLHLLGVRRRSLARRGGMWRKEGLWGPRGRGGRDAVMQI